MRVVVTGATGNVGTSLLRSLVTDDGVTSIVGIARRRPDFDLAKTTWQAADVAKDDLRPLFRGADVVVHLAWLIQPSHDQRALLRTNVLGSDRVFSAVAEAGVPALVYASSVGAYSPGPKDRLVDESWPTEGVRSSFYARHKAEVERRLDAFEQLHPDIRVVRLRPALIFKREAASEIRRLFFGPFLPSPLVRRSLIPLVPNVRDLRFQVVHSLDVGDAYRLAATKDVRGAFNVASDPVLDVNELRELLHARAVRVPQKLIRGAMTATWKLHLQPTPPGWFDMGVQVPLLDPSRARTELGWRPKRDARETVLELMDGLRRRSGSSTPPLQPGAGGPLRLKELLTGIGRR